MHLLASLQALLEYGTATNSIGGGMVANLREGAHKVYALGAAHIEVIVGIALALLLVWSLSVQRSR